MIKVSAAVAILLGLVVVALLAWRARLAARVASPARDEYQRLRRRLAALKVAYKNGKFNESTYHAHQRQLAGRLAELTRDGHPSMTGNPRDLALMALAATCLMLGAGLLVWPKLRLAPGGDAPAQSASQAASAAHPLSAEQLDRTVAKMRDQVKQNSKDATSWAMLAHSYDMLGRHTEASAAYAQLIELAPTDPQVLADAADSLALSRGRRLQGEPMKLIERALALDPKNLKALSLAGTEALDRNDPTRAVAYWQRARSLVTDPVLTREFDERIAEARALQARPASAVAAAPAQIAPPNPAAFVSGRIVLSDKLKSQVSANDVLFVFARPVEGSRMPIALMRRRASELPIEFRLDDSMAMVPQARLSTQARVIVGARVSKRGDASPQAGDLQGFSAPVAVGTPGLRLEIAEVVK